MPKRINLTGEKFGKLTVIEKYGKDKRGQFIWLCACECGNTHKVITRNLMAGTKSCGCLRGTTGTRKEANPVSLHLLYPTWSAMKQRCYNKNNAGYHCYGGRGIKMSKSWYLSFKQFVKDMGTKPSKKHSIDRINNDKGYNKRNCMWATKKEQANNRRSTIHRTYNGETLSLTEWAKRLNVKFIVV